MGADPRSQNNCEKVQTLTGRYCASAVPLWNWGCPSGLSDVARAHWSCGEARMISIASVRHKRVCISKMRFSATQTAPSRVDKA